MFAMRQRTGDEEKNREKIKKSPLQWRVHTKDDSFPFPAAGGRGITVADTTMRHGNGLISHLPVSVSRVSQLFLPHLILRSFFSRSQSFSRLLQKKPPEPQSRSCNRLHYTAYTTLLPVWFLTITRVSVVCKEQCSRESSFLPHQGPARSSTVHRHLSSAWQPNQGTTQRRRTDTIPHRPGTILCGSSPTIYVEVLRSQRTVSEHEEKPTG